MFLSNIRLVSLLVEAKGKNVLITLKLVWTSKIWTRISTGGIWIYDDMDQVKYLTMLNWFSWCLFLWPTSCFSISVPHAGFGLGLKRLVLPTRSVSSRGSSSQMCQRIGTHSGFSFYSMPHQPWNHSICMHASFLDHICTYIHHGNGGILNCSEFWMPVWHKLTSRKQC
jgi:hypothetical protein